MHVIEGQPKKYAIYGFMKVQRKNYQESLQMGKL